jgi:hypothetical protein
MAGIVKPEVGDVRVNQHDFPSLSLRRTFICFASSPGTSIRPQQQSLCEELYEAPRRVFIGRESGQRRRSGEPGDDCPSLFPIGHLCMIMSFTMLE